MSCNNYYNVYNFNYHTPTEWRYNSEQEITAAEEQRELAQRLTLEADRLFGQAKDSVIKNKLDIDYQSKVIIKDIEYKCKEIEKQKNDLDEEICLLLGYQVRIDNANKLLVGDALDAIAECLRLRNSRQSIDLVFDDVEKELLRERELILGINDKLQDLQDKVVLQIRKLRKFVYNLSVDFHCKKNALKIEEQNKNLNENIVKKSILNNKNIFKPATISTTEWDQFTLDIISAANKVLVDGRPIRAFFDKCLNKMFKDLVGQSAAVDLAFKLRVEEYLEVIEKLNKQRVETIKNIEEVQETIEKLKKAIDDREACLALAHTRLLNRTRREGVELCRDELELRLFDEVVQLENDVKSLQSMMAESVECRRRLKQSTARIDVQLQVKQNSFRIDNELCTEQRKRVNYRAF
ncbi:tektin-1-like [Rhopalosiphum maidis]|uniref:tektin-1-like n=1 Tax=Rhopalosiphum maidis TaxID=43146 RepID=UPI000F00780E|nr:tektin-1-like [Rhopalosiphum maidis]